MEWWDGEDDGYDDEDGDEPDAPLIDFVRLMPPAPKPLHNVDMGGAHCSGCLTRPSPWCAACGAPAAAATVAGGTGEAPRCAVSWCEHCLYELLFMRMESLCRHYSIKSFEPLEFLPFEPSASERDQEGLQLVAAVPHGSTAVLSSEARAKTTKAKASTNAKPKTRRRLASVVPTATTPDGTREPRRQSQSDSSPVGKSTAAQRRVTSSKPHRLSMAHSVPCGERTISRQEPTRGKRSDTGRRARRKGA